MEEEHRLRPDLFELNRTSPLGPILSIRYSRAADEWKFFPGWRQTRLFAGHEFDIVGPGREPTQAIVVTWRAIDDEFPGLQQTCIEAVEGYIQNLSSSEAASIEGTAINRGCVRAIAGALTTRTARINNIDFGDDGRFFVALHYPSIDDYYMTPCVAFEKMKVMDVVITP